METLLKTTPHVQIGHERIISLDIIRGFALFGILLVNMPLLQSPQLIFDLYMLPQQLTGSNLWIKIVLDVFIENKFFTIFSFLFGIGFFIFMDRTEKRGDRFYTLYTRRLLTLALFGTLHLVLLWYGDILLTYALAGFLLLFFYKRKEKTILKVIIAFTIAMVGLLSINFFVPAELVEKELITLHGDGAGKVEEAIFHYNHSNYSEWVAYRFQNEVIPVLQHKPFSVLTALYMFLVGLYVGKRKLISNFSSHQKLTKRVWWVSFIISVPLSALIVLLHLHVLNFGIVNELMIQNLATISGLSMSLLYITTILFLLQKGTWKKLLHPFSYVGRMALTNYLTQTLVGITIFTGLGWYGELNLTLTVIVCLILFPIQVLFSYLWLKKFRYGPMEWLWRKATFGRLL